MKKFITLFVLGSMSTALFAQTYTSQVNNQAGIDNYKTNGGNSSSVFAAESISQGTYAQYEIGEWNVAGFGIPSTAGPVTSVTLNVTDGGFSWETTGTFGVYFLSDNTTPLNNFKYSTANTQGFGSDISSNLTLLQEFTYTKGVFGQADQYTINLTPTESAYVGDILSTQSKFRLVIAAEDGTVATGFRGLGSTYSGKPSLTITTQAVPEPASFLVFAPAALLLLRRRSA